MDEFLWVFGDKTSSLRGASEFFDDICRKKNLSAQQHCWVNEFPSLKTSQVRFNHKSSSDAHRLPLVGLCCITKISLKDKRADAARQSFTVLRLAYTMGRRWLVCDRERAHVRTNAGWWPHSCSAFSIIDVAVTVYIQTPRFHFSVLMHRHSYITHLESTLRRDNCPVSTLGKMMLIFFSSVVIYPVNAS